jgi:hypothetical protein
MKVKRTVTTTQIAHRDLYRNGKGWSAVIDTFDNTIVALFWDDSEAKVYAEKYGNDHEVVEVPEVK